MRGSAVITFHYRSLLPPLAALAAVVLFARLGVWQLHRADEAQALRTTAEARLGAARVALDGETLAGDPSALHWRPVEARGSWLTQRQVLLDNQVSHGEAGYLVYTALHLPDCRCAVLVNRGWVPAGPRRDQIPDVAFTPAGGEVRGIAAPPPAAGFGLSQGPGEAVGPVLRVQRLDAPQLSRWIGEPVAPLTVLLAPEAPDGYRREWRPPDGRGDRHLAYAVQWFIFALIAAGVAVRLNSSRR